MMQEQPQGGKVRPFKIPAAVAETGNELPERWHPAWRVMDSATSGLESGPRLQERKWYTVDLELRCEDMIMLAIAHRQQFTTAARVLHQ